jgi:hypothetical protein
VEPEQDAPVPGPSRGVEHHRPGRVVAVDDHGHRVVDDIKRVVRRLLEDQVANLLPDARPWYARRLLVDIYIVAYGDAEATLGGLLASLDTGEAERLLRLLDPWVEPVVRLHPVNTTAMGPPWDRLNTTILANGRAMVDLRENPLLLRSLRSRGRYSGVNRSYRFRFYWILLPRPAFLTLGKAINFTGLDPGASAVATYPGYGGRVLRSGASRVVAHEAGHAMGLPHPFQRGEAADWLLDYAYTVMSYCDAVPAPLHGTRPWLSTRGSSHSSTA